MKHLLEFIKRLIIQFYLKQLVNMESIIALTIFLRSHFMPKLVLVTADINSVNSLVSTTNLKLFYNCIPKIYADMGN